MTPADNAATRPEAVHAPPWHVRDDEFSVSIIGKSGPGWYDTVAEDVSNHETADFIVRCVNEREQDLARVRDLRESLQIIASSTGHNQGCDEPDDPGCPRCVADAALAADDEALT